jgi:hypothetical protein
MLPDYRLEMIYFAEQLANDGWQNLAPTDLQVERKCAAGLQVSLDRKPGAPGPPVEIAPGALNPRGRLPLPPGSSGAPLQPMYL